jgi:cell division septum initiation protein DivIVA
VTDNRMKDRVKVMFNGTSTDGETSQHQQVAAQPGMANQALQVLTMAQRTAEEYIAKAHHQAAKIHADALAAAEQIGREAQAHAHNVRREADKVLYDARALQEQAAREGHARAEEAQQHAERVVSDAQARAAGITADAQASADQLRLQAQQRYDDVVGGLSAKREALQQQIEALEQFDREYRARLTSFMQGQMRALWADQPKVNGILEDDQEPDAVDDTVTAELVEPEEVEEQEEFDDSEERDDDAASQAPIPTQRHHPAGESQPLGAHATADD